ncbi:ABC transporter ATP-binding protein [bacterium]|nr:ABC transporter ATP-binding protein [bacterium]
MNESLLTLQEISAALNGRAVLKEVSFDVKQGEFFSLLGPSGCGKTTLLRIIAGFLTSHSGKLLWSGTDITHLPPQSRDLNLVFQNYALFPHLNVFENVAFGLRMMKLDERIIIERVKESLALVRMSEHALRRVTELSGGQQQRIALARAVAPRPKLVLLDEPLGALDLQLRRDMQVELKSLQRQLGMTFLYVTHDQEEAFSMSDRIAILNSGQLEQVDAPEVLYSLPASRFVAKFIGNANFIPVERTALATARCLASQQEYSLNMANTSLANSASNSASNANNILGDVLVRPEQVELVSTPLTNQTNSLSGTIQLRQFLGANVRYHLELEGPERRMMIVDQPSTQQTICQPGEKVLMRLPKSPLPFFPADSAQ